MKAADILAIIGSNIKVVRQDRGWTQQELAERLGKARQAIQKLETGTVNPRFLTVVEVAKALDVSVGYLLTGVLE